MNKEQQPLNLRRKIAYGALAASFAWYVKQQLDELKQQTPIWKYKSHPPHPGNWDVAARTAFDPFIKLFGDGVMAHFFDFVRIDPNPNFQGINVETDPKATKRDNLLKEFWADTRWGWQNAQTLALDHDQIQKEERVVNGWQFAFKLPSEDKITVCKIVIPAYQEIKFLLGDVPVTVFALDLKGNELPAKTGPKIHRRDRNHKDKRLF